MLILSNISVGSLSFVVFAKAQKSPNAAVMWSVTDNRYFCRHYDGNFMANVSAGTRLLLTISVQMVIQTR